MSKTKEKLQPAVFFETKLEALKALKSDPRKLFLISRNGSDIGYCIASTQHQANLAASQNFLVVQRVTASGIQTMLWESLAGPKSETANQNDSVS